MIKQHLFNEHVCDYCEKECYNFYAVIVDGQWYNGHKNCMPKLKKELNEDLKDYRKIQDDRYNETLESVKREMI